MEDSEIIRLYLSRSEQAVTETDRKYGGYCYAIAYNILANREDSEESVSDTYLAAWNTIPPKRPNPLAPYLGRITRHLSIDAWRRRGAEKRGSGELPLALEELEECIGGGDDLQRRVEAQELLAWVQKFLQTLPERERRVFVCRYWYMDSVSDIARRFGTSPNNISTMLRRTRGKLSKAMQKEELGCE